MIGRNRVSVFVFDGEPKSNPILMTSAVSKMNSPAKTKREPTEKTVLTFVEFDRLL